MQLKKKVLFLTLIPILVICLIMAFIVLLPFSKINISDHLPIDIIDRSQNSLNIITKDSKQMDRSETIQFQHTRQEHSIKASPKEKQLLKAFLRTNSNDFDRYFERMLSAKEKFKEAPPQTNPGKR